MSIQIKQLTHIYNPETPFEKIALKNIDLEIQLRTFTAIIGHTGSGKSTLIQMFNGLLKPTSGQVMINNVDINGEDIERKQIRQQVGLVFQYPEYQLFEMSVYKDVAYGPKNLGLGEDEIDKRVKHSLNAVGLKEELWEKSPFELSGGQKRRVAIAGVLAMNPSILILDEPTAGLDPKGREELFNQLKYMHETLGITVILISHSMEDVAKYAEQLIVLHEGNIAFKGTPRQVFRHVEELEQIGLAPPQIKYIVQELRQQGIPIDNSILTVEEAAQKLIEYFNKGGDSC
ncbi:MAG: energy-coupling factor transporter ATPase [Cellulosilyticaceae bacterium]